MDKKSLIGLLLIAGVLFIWSKFFVPKPPVIEADNKETIDQIDQSEKRNEIEPKGIDKIEELKSDNASISSTNPLQTKEDSIRWKIENEKLSEEHGIFSPSLAIGKSEANLLIENDKIQVFINPVGGTIEKINLKEYKTWLQDSLILMDKKSEMSFILPYKNGNYLDTKDYKFEAVGSPFSVSGTNSKELKLRLNTNDPSKYLEYTYSMEGGDYEVDFQMELHNLENEVNLRRDDVVYKWNLVGISNEKSKEFEDRKSSIFYKYFDEDRDYLSETSDEEIQVEAKLEWIAMKQYFFSAVAIPENGFSPDHSTMSIAAISDTAYTKTYDAELTFPLSDDQNPKGRIKFFFGPNHYEVLNTYDNGMTRIIDLGWGIFGWMNKWLVIPVFNFLNNYIGSYGIIILLLTLIIKMLLFPLTYKNYMSSAKMKVLKPDIAELTAKFSDDPMKKQQATMSLYRSSGVNPMAGCIPMLIQMPVLYAMFNFFPSSIELRQQPFLWANDLSTYDSILSIPKLPFYGDHVSLFTLLMALSTILYTRMNSSQMPEAQPGMPNMKVMMYIFPFMMLFFFNSYPSGLSYYYLLANVISMLQMFVIKKYFIDEDKIRVKIDSNKKRPAKKKSKFQQRLEEASRQQQAAKSRKR